MSGLTVALRLTADGSQLVGEIRGSEDALKKLGATSRDAGKQVATGLDGASTAADRFRETAAKLVTAGGALYAFEKIKDMAGAVGGTLITAEAQVVKFRAAFGTLGDANLVAREFEYVRSISREMGIELTSAANSYTKLAMASRGTALEGKATQEIFTSIAQASTAMGLSAAETEGALLAISQMISKGVVSAEELRGQLGERLPGAFQIAARAMGVTTAELGKMLEQGEILAEDFLPRFGRQVTKELGQASKDAATTAARELERLKSGWNELVMAISDAGAADGISRVLRGIGDDFAAVAERIRIAKLEGAGFLGQAWAAISSTDVRTADQRLGDADRTLADPNAGFYQRWQAGNARDRAASQLGTLGMAGGYTDETARGSAAAAVKAYTAQKTAADAAAKAVDGYASATARLSDAQRKAADIAKENAEFQKAVAGLSRDSAEYARAEAAHKTALTNIEERYTKSKGAGTAASKARRDALENEREKQDGLNETIKLALDLDEKRQKAAEIEADLAMTRLERYEEAEAAAAKQIQSADDMLAAIERETALMGASNLERETTLALLELEKTLVGDTAGEYERYAEKVRDAVANREIRRAAIESAEELRRAGDRAADQVGQAFAQSIMDGGKSAADQLKRLFANLVLTPAVNAVVNPIAQGVTSAFSGGGSGVSSGLSLASSLGSLGSLGSFAATGFLNTIGGTGMMSGLSAAGSLMSGGSIAGGLGMGLGAVAPYAMAAYALYSLLSSGGEKRAGSTYGYSASDLQYGQGLKGIWSDDVAGMIGAGSTRFIGGPSGGDIGGETIRASVAATVEGINGLFDRLGSTDKIDQFWGKLEQSEKGRGGVFSGGTLASGASFGESSWESGTSRTLTAEEAIQAFALDLQQATIQALQSAADIPSAVADALAGVDAESLTQEQVGALLQSVESIVSVTAAMAALGVQADAVTTAMLAAAGGADVLSSAAASYYQGYYSESERVGALSEQLAGQIGALGLEMPGTRDEFRALVESLDLTTAQGQSAYGTLLTLSDAFGVVADSAAAAADESLRAAQESARAALDAQSAATEAEIAAMVRAFGDLEGAMIALDAPAENLVEQWQSASQQLADMTRELDRILGTGEAGPFDALAQTVASLASASRGIEAIDQMRFGVATSAASDQSVELMAQRERELFAELRTAADPAAVAQELAQVALARIKMAGDLSGQALADEYREQYESARAVLDLQRESRDEQISALREQISAAEQMRRIIGGMRGVIDDLLVGDLSALGPEGRLGAARQSYDRTLAGARAGDVSAMSEYADALRTYLGQSQSYYGGATSEYASAFATALAEAEEMAGAQVSDVELLSSQLETLQSMDIEQAEMRRTVIDTSAEQLAALDSIGAALRERESALQRRQDEQASAARQQVDLLSAMVEGQEAEIRQRAAAMQALQEQLAKLQDQIGRIQSSVESIEVAA
jgi:tape measure domain-containing protein